MEENSHFQQRGDKVRGGWSAPCLNFFACTGCSRRALTLFRQHHLFISPYMYICSYYMLARKPTHFLSHVSSCLGQQQYLLALGILSTPQQGLQDYRFKRGVCVAASCKLQPMQVIACMYIQREALQCISQPTCLIEMRSSCKIDMVPCHTDVPVSYSRQSLISLHTLNLFSGTFHQINDLVRSCSCSA